MPSEEIDSVSALLKALKESAFADLKHSHARVWFRGHASVRWELTPGVYRDGFPAADENSRLNIERHLSQDFRISAAALLREAETAAQVYFLQQHYRMPTRLLDWTTSPLHGLYFAAQPAAESEDDGELFIMDAYELAETQQADGFRGIADERHRIVTEGILDPIFRSRGCFPDHIFPIRPDQLDRRVTLQRACFTFHVPNRPVLTNVANRTLRRYVIRNVVKEAIRNELFLLGIDEFAVYGNLEALSQRLKRAYKITVDPQR